MKRSRIQSCLINFDALALKTGTNGQKSDFYLRKETRGKMKKF